MLYNANVISFQVQFPCINPKKQEKKRKYENSGIVHLTSFKVQNCIIYNDLNGLVPEVLSYYIGTAKNMNCRIYNAF